MSRKIEHYKPREGLTVMDPLDGSVLPPEGGRVVIRTRRQEIYYQRRLADGDISLCRPQPVAKPASSDRED